METLNFKCFQKHYHFFCRKIVRSAKVRYIFLAKKLRSAKVPYIFSAKNMSTFDFKCTRRLNESLTIHFVKLMMLRTTKARL